MRARNALERSEWSGRVAIVTGASSGIGLAVAEAIVHRGGRVALVARTAPKLEAIVDTLGASHAASFAVDVADRSSLVGLPARVLDRFGRLDVVVNNAGVNHRGAVQGRCAEELAAIVETNLLAPILLSQAALPYLRGGAAIVNVASLAGKVPVPGEATYSATKAGLRAFTRALAFELRERGIHVASVCPGPVATGFFGDLAAVPDLVFSQPMSTVEQVADAVLHAVEARVPEVDVPALSGRLATLGYLAPTLFARLRPVLDGIGARNKQRFLERRRAVAGGAASGVTPTGSP